MHDRGQAPVDGRSAVHEPAMPGRAAVARRVLERRRPDRLDAGRLRGAARGPAAARGRPPVRRPATRPPGVSLIVAAYREEAVIAAKVANALALDWPRDRLEVDRRGRRRRRAGPTPPPSAPARPAPTSCSSCRAAARSARRTPPCAPRAASCSRSPTPTRCGSPTRCALLAPVRRPAVGYACGQVRSSTRRDQPGGPVLALRDVAARARVGARVGHRRQRRDLRACAARPTSRSTR